MPIVNNFSNELDWVLNVHVANRAHIEYNRTRTRNHLITRLNEEGEALAGLPASEPVVQEFRAWRDEMLAQHDDHWNAQLAQEEGQYWWNVHEILSFYFPDEN